MTKTTKQIEEMTYRAIRDKAIEHASKAHNRESMRVSSIRE